MKAITDFDATRELIQHAFKTFSRGFELMKLREEQARANWVDQKVAKAWFNKSRKHWEAYSRGEVGDSFESYQMTYAFKEDNYHWFKARLKDAEELLQKFDCAVVDCQASEVILTDSDLTLLSVSLDSAIAYLNKQG